MHLIHIVTFFPYTTLFRSQGTVLSDRARLLKTDIKDTRENSRVFFYFKWFCPLSWETESRANFDFAEYGFRYEKRNGQNKDRKSTRLNSSHVAISYAVFCL